MQYLAFAVRAGIGSAPCLCDERKTKDGYRYEIRYFLRRVGAVQKYVSLPTPLPWGEGDYQGRHFWRKPFVRIEKRLNGPLPGGEAGVRGNGARASNCILAAQC